MIINCEDCGKKYRIDPSSIKGQEVKYPCKSCNSLMVIRKAQSNDVAYESDTNISASMPSDSVYDTISHEDQNTSSQKHTTSQYQEDSKSNRTGRLRFGLTARMVAVMLMVSLVPLGIFWGITFEKTSTRIQMDTERLSKQITTDLANHVDEWIDKNFRVLKALSNMPDIISMDRKRQEPLLKAVQNEYPWMYLVFTLDTNGMNIARNDGNLLKDYSDRQYYKDILKGEAVAWQTLIGKTSKKPAVVLAVPIRNGNQVVGVMANAMQIDDMSKRIANWKQGKSGYAFLVDEKGKVVAHQIEEYVFKERNLSQHPLISSYKDGQKGMIFFGEDQDSWVGYVAETKLGWHLATQQKETEAFDILQKAKFFALMLLGITIIAVFAIAFISAKAIVKPIKTLTEAADRISVGELDVEIETKSKDEIGDLADAISRMQDSIRLSIERLRRRRQ